MNEIVNLLKSLSDKNRMRLVAILTRYDELCGCQLTELLKVTNATVSRHLSLLVQSGVLESRKEGRWVYYSLVKNSPRNKQLLEFLESELKNSKQFISDQKEMNEIVQQNPEEICRKQRRDSYYPS